MSYSYNLLYLLTQITVWKLVLLMHCKCAYCRSQLWLRFPPGTIHAIWVRGEIHSRMSVFVVISTFDLTSCFYRLIFPRWDVIVITLSIFLLTYTYIEAKSNYHRGSILILRYEPFDSLYSHFNNSHSYAVMISGFYFAPHEEDDTRIELGANGLTYENPLLSWKMVQTVFFSIFSR